MNVYEIRASMLEGKAMIRKVKLGKTPEDMFAA